MNVSYFVTITGKQAQWHQPQRPTCVVGEKPAAERRCGDNTPTSPEP